MFLNSIWKGVFEKEQKEFTLFDFKTSSYHDNVELVKGHTDQGDRMKSPERDPYMHHHLAPDKGAKAIPVKHKSNVWPSKPRLSGYQCSHGNLDSFTAPYC